MSNGFDRYASWLNASGHDRAPGYYGLLRLAAFEADSDRIQQALFQESLDVSNFLRGPHREQAEAVLEEINRAESCLTNPASKADYDARLRASPGEVAQPPIEMAKKPQAAEATRPLPSKSARDDAAAVADRSVWEAIERARRRTTDDSRKKAIPHAPPSPSPATASDEALPQGPAQKQELQTISLSSAVSQALVARVPAPLVKHRKPIAVGMLLVLGLGFAAPFMTSALDPPRPPRVRIRLDPEEEILLSQQISVLYNLNHDTATRAAAAEKLRSASADAIRKFSYNLGDLASKQPEAEIQQALRSLLDSAGSGS